eukprot:13528663-Alexandrium_andersonii.AAC.1
MSASLVGSEMCIRDSIFFPRQYPPPGILCLLCSQGLRVLGEPREWGEYFDDAADRAAVLALLDRV